MKPLLIESRARNSKLVAAKLFALAYIATPEEKNGNNLPLKRIIIIIIIPIGVTI